MSAEGGPINSFKSHIVYDHRDPSDGSWFKWKDTTDPEQARVQRINALQFALVLIRAAKATLHKPASNDLTKDSDSSSNSSEQH
jgi:hypothetical protein